MQDARALAGNSSHGLTDWQKAEALDRHAHLDHEQRAAFDRATGPGGFSMIVGEAGTGKSTTISAVRDAYAEAGYRVIGMSWTNPVVHEMRDDGFAEAETIKSELMRVQHGSSIWNNRTVLIVDEAAQLSTRAIADLMAAARASGAKVIGVGDDAQLASIERGGLFGALRQEHGAAELHTVRRVTDAEERRAWNRMHEGDFRPALDLFDRKGAITWAQTAEEARAALVEKYAADTAAEPGKTRFVFANSNAEVAELNRDLRTLAAERGQLGADYLLKGTDGPAHYAKGDRIMFTASVADPHMRRAGFINGAAGTIDQIDGQRITVTLDGKKGRPGRTVAFSVGDNAEAGEFNSFRHGYAGTIYKGQGRTLDQTYVLHSASMGAASSYVGLSRHRESVNLFTTRGADAWMMATGGVEGLTEPQHKSAEKSYARWTEAKPELAARHGFADYVSYVQDQQAKRAPDHSGDLDRLARQMGRVEERRSASQFHSDGRKDTGSFGDAARGATGSPQDGRETPAGAMPQAGGQSGPTARSAAMARGIGARIAAIRNPFRQAQALHRAHVRDADAVRIAQLVAKRAAEERAGEHATQQAEARRQGQLERDQMARDVMERKAAGAPKATETRTPAPDPKPAAQETTRPAGETTDITADRIAKAKAAAEHEAAERPERERGRFRDRGRTR
nr:AAA family ATPase [Novosphingobium sp. FKTRR1]